MVAQVCHLERFYPLARLLSNACPTGADRVIEGRMGQISTATLHERADAAAQTGDFAAALRNSAEALRAAPLDHQARLKTALCLAALGLNDVAVGALRAVAELLFARGFVLSAIGACRDAFTFQPGAPQIRELLGQIHQSIHGLEGRGRARVPPPIAPTQVDDEQEGSLLSLKDKELIDRASELALALPELEKRELEPTVVPLFSDMSREVFVSLVEKLGYLKVPADHHVVREGDEGKSLFILLQGEVLVSKGEGAERRELARLGAGTLFGELALITSKPRSASVVTTGVSELFEIERKNVDEVAAKHPSITEDLVKFARRRLLMNLMATSKIFAPFDDSQRLQILKAFQSKIVPKGTVLIQDGKEPDALYLVLEGEVEVSKIDEAGDKVVLSYLREGEVFGEIGLLEQRLTTATVTAAEQSVLLYLDENRFTDFVRSHPQIEQYLSGLSAWRIEETSQAMSADGVILDADDLIIL
jgi:CRP-like cAMP-binding protein